MKKKLFILFALAVFVAIAVLITSVVVSFKVVKPATERINQKLTVRLAKIVNIPEGIRSQVTFGESLYAWEMETNQNEVVGVSFKYNPAFLKNENQITAVLEMRPDGDPSIFTKSLSAIIFDRKALNSALDPQKADLSENKEAGYKKMEIETSPKTGQATKISWQFEKEDLGEDLISEYKNLDRIPSGVLKFLYSIHNLTTSLLRG